jgi:hypothetical protein
MSLRDKIWETLDKFGSGVLAPKQVRRVGRATNEMKREEILMVAQTEREIEAIKAGRKTFDVSTGRLIDVSVQDAMPPLLEDHSESGSAALPVPEARLQLPPPQSTDEFADAVRTDMLASQMQKALNVRKIAIYADEEAEARGDQTSSDKDVDPDWFTQWRMRSENVSSEVLQRLWGKVLAGECERPGSYSIHTMHLLSGMSKQDAELIGLLGPFVLNHEFIFKDTVLLAANRLPFGTLLGLEEVGIISGVQGVGLMHAIEFHGSNQVVAIYRVDGRTLVAWFPVSDLTLQIPVYRLTRTGQEIMSLGQFVVNDNYLKAFAEYLKGRGANRVMVGRIEYHPSNTFSLYDGQELVSLSPPVSASQSAGDTST